jgi:hypothetical protein
MTDFSELHQKLLKTARAFSLVFYSGKSVSDEEFSFEKSAALLPAGQGQFCGCWEAFSKFKSFWHKMDKNFYITSI